MKKRKTFISQDELEQAIARYLKMGGRIVRLPEQKAVLSSLVGKRWSNTEVEFDPHP